MYIAMPVAIFTVRRVATLHSAAISPTYITDAYITVVSSAIGKIVRISRKRLMRT